MRDIFIFSFMVSLVPAILRWPFLGILAWNVVSYMNPHQLGWGMTNSLPFGMLIGLTTIMAFAFSDQHKKSIPLTPITVLLLVFLGYMDDDHHPSRWRHRQRGKSGSGCSRSCS